MLLQIKNFRFWMQAKMGQRGAALVEYAVLLAFVSVIAVSFLGNGAMAGSIKGIIKKISDLLNLANQNASNGTTTTTPNT